MSQRFREIAVPSRTPETEAYWESAGKGVLLVKRCRSCGEAHHFPRAICPFCFSDLTEWQQASGKGVIYSFSVMRRAPIPYVIAYVTLEEGPTMMTNIIGCDFDAVAIGKRVNLVPGPGDDGPLIPMFTLDLEQDN